MIGKNQYRFLTKPDEVSCARQFEEFAPEKDFRADAPGFGWNLAEGLTEDLSLKPGGLFARKIEGMLRGPTAGHCNARGAIGAEPQDITPRAGMLCQNHGDSSAGHVERVFYRAKRVSPKQKLGLHCQRKREREENSKHQRPTTRGSSRQQHPTSDSLDSVSFSNPTNPGSALGGTRSSLESQIAGSYGFGLDLR